MAAVLPCALANVSAQNAACTMRASASGASVYLYCLAKLPPPLLNRSRNPFGPPNLNSSQSGCGTVSHTDSLEPRWNVLIRLGVDVPSSHWPKPYRLPTSRIHAGEYMLDVP